LVGSGGLKLDTLQIKGAGALQSAGNQIGVYVTLGAGVASRYNLTVTNCEFLNLQRGVFVDAQSPFIGITLTDNICHDLWYCGLMINRARDATDFGTTLAQNIVITGNSCYDIDGNTTIDIYQSYGIVVLCCSNFLIEGNLIHDIGGTATNGAGATWCAECDNGIFRGNEIYNVSVVATADGSGIDVDAASSNIVVELNYIHDCEGQGLVCFQFALGGAPVGARAWTDVTFRFNVVQNCASKAYGSFAFAGSGFSNLYVYHNTFIQTDGTGPDTIITTSLNVDATNITNANFWNNVPAGERFERQADSDQRGNRCYSGKLQLGEQSRLYQRGQREHRLPERHVHQRFSVADRQ
jgi:hypothetical protein